MPTRPEPGSFRDPDSRVLYEGSSVLRALSAGGLADFEMLQDSGLLEDPRLIGTERLRGASVPTDVTAEAVLRHDRVPFVSYPYEWTFSMLQDAALLQLDLLLAAVDHDLMLKDASAYNVQFRGSRPVFVDVGSFERLRETELWVGYRQFCMHFLFPLWLQAHRNVAFQPLLRGAIDGIPAAQVRAMSSLRDAFRRGYLTHVYLQARLDQRDTGPRGRLEAQLARPGLGTRLIRANVTKMRRLVQGLRWTPASGVWTTYGAHNSYTLDDAARKDAFVEAAASTRRWSLAWDLGCNEGRHARIVARHADAVVALDADPGTVELLYRDLRKSGSTGILPLTMNLADPSPGLGWRGVERGPLLARGRPELVLALALVHHLSIGCNIPLANVVDWLASIGGAVVAEFPSREDPMVARLLSAKREGLHSDYERGHFERCLAERFHVRRTEVLGSGTRVLYYVEPRASS
jgi:ribosomal protein L11 methylase PrmA